MSNYKSFHIANENFWFNIESEFGQAGGIYKLVCIQKGKPLPICRLTGKDNNGILYIGKATSFLNRVIELKKSISKGYETLSHEAGFRYLEIDTIQKHFPYKDLYVLLKVDDNTDTPEQEALKSYVNEFGEPPPLNRIG